MTWEGLDPTAIGGGLSILATMVIVIRLAFNRLDKQDGAWLELLNAAERRAASAEATLAELRKFVAEASVSLEKTARENRGKIDELTEQLRLAENKIRNLQKEGEK